ncbi:hypothetical protein [Bradyrhizobium sp. LMG 9283]|uniref:hypothetical protein n=1 Tax=Bradyrhizobium sp. LMG 9283 TaxID=592064 RepID=UPI00388F0884
MSEFSICRRKSIRSPTLPAAKQDIATWWNLNTEFTGSWTNEGDITSTSDAMPVALKMRVYSGKADGEIWSNGLSATIHPTILWAATCAMASWMPMLSTTSVERKLFMLSSTFRGRATSCL